MSTTTNKQWETEFGADYDCPGLPEGWRDDSWHNDASPRFVSESDELLQLWIEHPNPAMREFGLEVKRFQLMRYATEDQEWEDAEVLVETDDWNEILNAIQ